MNCKGSSLISVLIATSLLAGLSAALIQINKGITGSNIRYRSIEDETELKSKILYIIKRPNLCTVSLAGEEFVKSEIIFDGATSTINQGHPIELWTADVSGASRGHKKLNGANNIGVLDKSLFGNLTIDAINLVMNDTDDGQIVVIYKKRSSGTTKITKRLTFDVDLNFTTTGTTSTISSCNTASPPAAFPLLRVVWRTIGRYTYTPRCPTGTKAVSCGNRKSEAGNEDSVGCRVDIGGNRCQGWRDASGSRDQNAIVYCYCR